MVLARLMPIGFVGALVGSGYLWLVNEVRTTVTA
jgi:hypothetical protein